MTDERRLDPFLDAAVAEAERAAQRPPPSFAAVLARAHSLAPDAVPPPAAAPALTALPSGHVPSAMSNRPDAGSPRAGSPSGHAPSATSDRPNAPRTGLSFGHAPSAMSEQSSTDPQAADLAPFLAAARGLADADVTARLRRPPPPLPRPRPRLPLLVLAAAAAVLLVAGAGAWRRLADLDPSDRTGAQADDTVRDRPQQHRSEPRAPLSQSPRDMSPGTFPEGHTAVTPEPAATPPAEPALEPVAGSLSADAPVVEPRPVPGAAPASPRPSPVPSTSKPPAAPPSPTDPLGDQLARLDDEAEASLLAGALDDADARYQQMIAIGGRRAAVEHAYADRWLLARRRGDDDGHGELLRAYLKKFPRGRFADEASAGLCRLADADARPDCWRAYSERFPGGAYRREADEATLP
ncbi:hypothetical protein [Nannocystis punicea]|uniref:Uncharacterized protein n=1 Tax=Nannocystis punicea TaxID=2995304 RepID=A0ABY7HCZ7_9BACT|nr:hypothetical protein [Nannocystis poenicansa]WAS96864.1 hypothetical protein O0S08_12010 [Nannocystis poenicansa]